ncbi:MAG: TraR/DksA family transcriptional regulator [Saprospiraceae bacterium]|nr:TraR/DksA family transcriptional regulator [Saprospiraceae bacterium]
MDTEKRKQELLLKKEELISKESRVTQGIRHTENELSRNFEDQATERENDEVLDALKNGINLEIRQIDAALMRINEGSYGICVSCGKQVGAKRQEALPYATQCIECASN